MAQRRAFKLSREESLPVAALREKFTPFVQLFCLITFQDMQFFLETKITVFAPLR
jgi:hypothetical protein